MLNKLYKTLYVDLVSLASVAGVDEAELQKYFVPEGNTTSESILLRLCSSLQNSGMMHNSIKFNDRNNPANRAIIESVMCGYNTKAAAAKYDDWQSIYNAMVAAGIVDNGIGEKKETNWEKYCRGLYDGIHFLTDESGEQIIRNLAAVSVLTDKEIREIKTISTKIHGLGFALTCDWLKECGCVWLAKPDVHINGVIKHLKNVDKITDDEVLKEMFSWAELVRTNNTDTDATAYKLDKIIWLLCTGEFYLDDGHIGRDAIFKKVDMLKA